MAEVVLNPKELRHAKHREGLTWREMEQRFGCSMAALKGAIMKRKEVTVRTRASKGSRKKRRASAANARGIEAVNRALTKQNESTDRIHALAAELLDALREIGGSRIAVEDSGKVTIDYHHRRSFNVGGER